MKVFKWAGPSYGERVHFWGRGGSIPPTMRSWKLILCTMLHLHKVLKPAKNESCSPSQSWEINFTVSTSHLAGGWGGGVVFGGTGGCISTTMRSSELKLCTMLHSYKDLKPAKYQSCSPQQSWEINCTVNFTVFISDDTWEAVVNLKRRR
jgi:hypothetical protein